MKQPRTKAEYRKHLHEMHGAPATSSIDQRSLESLRIFHAGDHVEGFGPKWTAFTPQHSHLEGTDHMKRNRSNARTHATMVSELDALSIYLALQGELKRRRDLKLRHDDKSQAHLQALIDEYRFIADAEPCANCGTSTLGALALPVEGDGESGPYTIDRPWCGEGECRDQLCQEWFDPEPRGPHHADR